MSTSPIKAGRAVSPPTKHQLALMIWIAVFPTLTVLNLLFGGLLTGLRSSSTRSSWSPSRCPSSPMGRCRNCSAPGLRLITRNAGSGMALALTSPAYLAATTLPGACHVDVASSSGHTGTAEKAVMYSRRLWHGRGGCRIPAT